MTKEGEQNNLYSELVRKLKGSDYSDALGTIQDDLNLPARTSYAEMEALLIFAVRKAYGNRRNADIALMALGLLSGFDNREGNLETQQAKDLYAERREQFLLKTNYISIQSKGKFNTYEDAKQAVRSVDKNGSVKSELDTIRSTLDSATSRVLLKVISSLYGKKGTANNYLEEAKSRCEKIAEEQNIGKINWTACDYIRKELLPSLKFYKRLPSVSPQPKPIPAPNIDTEGWMGKNPTGDTEPPPPEPPTPEPKPKFPQMLFLFAFLIPIFVFCAPIIHQYAISINILPQLNVNAVSYSEREIFPGSKDFDTSTVEGVKITNPDLVITQGCMTLLKVEITPAEAADSDLYYSTSNIHAVVVSPSGWVIALKSYQSQEPSITAQVAVSSLNGKSDETSVTVLYPDVFPASIWSDLEGD